MRAAVLDIGGTMIKSGIWNDGRLEKLRERPTEAEKGGQRILELAEEILLDLGSFDAVGVSTAGQVDPLRGCIRYANENIPGYTGMEIRKLLEQRFGVPVAVENDVNAAALGEGWMGAARKERDFLCVTYGTGVGGAIVMEKKIYRGAAFSAGEFGGILIHPEARRPGEPFSGCYEKYASATALVRRGLCLDPALDSGRKIFARIGEESVREAVDAWIDEIVLGLLTLIHIFNPSCIVLGGGVMEQPYVLKQIREKLKRQTIPGFEGVRVCQASLGNSAGLLGAAYLACALERSPKKQRRR